MKTGFSSHQHGEAMASRLPQLWGRQVNGVSSAAPRVRPAAVVEWGAQLRWGAQVRLHITPSAETEKQAQLAAPPPPIWRSRARMGCSVSYTQVSARPWGTGEKRKCTAAWRRHWRVHHAPGRGLSLLVYGLSWRVRGSAWTAVLVPGACACASWPARPLPARRRRRGCRLTR